SLGDALDPLLADDLRVRPLGLRHRSDHRLDADELLVVEGDPLRQLAEERKLLEEVVHRPHLLDQLDLLDEVVEVELAGEYFFGVLLGLFFVDYALEVLHQPDDVAEAEDAARQPLGAELLQLVEPLAHADELDGLAGDLLDGERRAAARVAVELREDESVEM